MKSEAITLRLATLQDAAMLLAWRNDAATRQASHHTGLIHPEEHLDWLTRLLHNPDQRLFIAEEGGHAVGTARACVSEGICELSWTVAPSARGRGIAKRMVSLLARDISTPLKAEIKADNVASVEVAEHVGMTLERRVGSVLYYSRPALQT